MDPSLLIGLGGKLLEGFFANRAAKQQRAQSVEDVKQQFVRLREGAELAGFNPLAVLGTASGIPAQAGSGAYMGTALADSALMIADSLARSKKAGTLNKVNALEAENRDLLGRLTAMTLRPKVPGIYGGGDGTAAAGPAGGPVPGDRAETARSDTGTAPPQVTLRLFGRDFAPVAETSDAESFETRYGELASELVGLGALAKDFRHFAFMQRVDRGARGRNGAGREKHPLERYRAPMMGRWSGVYTPDMARRFPWFGFGMTGARLSVP